MDFENWFYLNKYLNYLLKTTNILIITYIYIKEKNIILDFAEILNIDINLLNRVGYNQKKFFYLAINLEFLIFNKPLNIIFEKYIRKNIK